MNNNDKDLKPKHPIGVVAKRTGVSPDLLRAWERRYGAIVPQRTQTGRRLYTDRDIARVTLLKQLISAGRRISDVSGLGLQELEALAKEDRDAVGRGPVHRSTGDPARHGGKHLETAIDAVIRYDQGLLERTLAVAALTMSSRELRRDLIVPLLHEIGERWREGAIRIVQEHMASAIVKSFLESQRKRSSGGTRPMIAVTTPSGQLHEMGALIAAVVAEEAGWDVVYLGANLPADEIGNGARSLGVRAVALSVVYMDDEEKVAEEIRLIGQQLGPQVAMIVGGRVAAALEDVVREAGGIPVEDLDELREQLDRLRDRSKR